MEQLGEFVTNHWILFAALALVVMLLVNDLAGGIGRAVKEVSPQQAVQLMNRDGAAILDVTRTEPLPPGDPLWDAPNMYLSPHSSSSQDRYLEALFELFTENLDRYVHGVELRNVVDLRAGY